VRYERLEHTADILVRAYGRDRAEQFANAAYALTDSMMDASKVRPVALVRIEAGADDLEGLLQSFLSEVLFVLDADGVALSEFDVRIDGTSLRCDARGEAFDRIGHEPRTEVKAISFHGMKLDEGSLTVLFDV